MAGDGFGAGGDFFRGAGDDDAAAVARRAGAEVDDTVGGFHQLQVVFDDDQRVADVEEGFEAIDQLYDVGEVEAGGRFVEDEERAAVAFGGEVGGELEALRFAAGERGRGLAEAEVVEADVDQEFQLATAACGGRGRR